MWWGILYDDNTWFTSEDGEFWEAPRVGVQGILQDDLNVGVETVDSPDGYWYWKDNMWFGADKEGMYDYLRTHMSPEICVLQGRWVNHDKWQKLLNKIAGRKSSRYQHERLAK